jgi:hypothetical protein
MSREFISSPCSFSMPRVSLTSVIRRVREGLISSPAVVAPIPCPQSVVLSPSDCIARTVRFIDGLDIWGTEKSLFGQNLVSLVHAGIPGAGLRTEGNGKSLEWSVGTGHLTSDDVINACILKSLQGYTVTLVGDDTAIPEILRQPDSHVQYISKSGAFPSAPPINGSILDALTILRVLRHELEEKRVFEISGETSDLLNFLDPKEAAGFEKDTINEFLEVADEVRKEDGVVKTRNMYVFDGKKPISPIVIKHVALDSLVAGDDQVIQLHVTGEPTVWHRSVASFVKCLQAVFEVKFCGYTDITGYVVVDPRDMLLVPAPHGSSLVKSVDGDPFRLVTQHLTISAETLRQHPAVRILHSGSRVFDCRIPVEDDTAPL